MPSQAADSVRIEIEGALAEKVQLWERQLTVLQAECGCKQGALGLLVGTLGYFAYLFLRSGGWGDPGWYEFWFGLGAVTITTSLAKFLGLVAAQRKLNRVIKEIQSEWRSRHLPAKSAANTGG